MSIIDDHSGDFSKPIEHFSQELQGLRSGRANAGLVENITIDAYGTATPIKQMGNIAVTDSKSMTIEPWDKGMLAEIEKAIQAANVGLRTANEGTHIRVSVPEMTEDSRKELVKVLKTKMEEARVTIRGVRDKVKDEILAKEKSGELTEDDKFRLQKELDEYTAKCNDEIKQLADAKEKEIMTV